MFFGFYNTLYNNNGIGKNVTLFDKFTSYDLQLLFLCEI